MLERYPVKGLANNNNQDPFVTTFLFRQCSLYRREKILHASKTPASKMLPEQRLVLVYILLLTS